MGRHAIVEKLQGLLDKGIETEAEVVYLLVEVRKLLEIRNLKEKNEDLVFRCDWAVHSKMDRTMAKRILHTFDLLQHEINKERTPDPANTEDMKGLVLSTHFRTQLSSLLKSEGLPTKLCNGPDWPSFLNLYGAVISDSPLTISPKSPKGASKTPIPEPTYVSKIVVTVHPNTPTAGRFIAKWRIDFKKEPSDHKLGEVNVDMADSRLLEDSKS